MITLPGLAESTAIRHAFFTRKGGVSEGIFASLNCGFGSGDDVDKVAENRGRAASMLDLDADRLVTCYQIHSATVIRADRAWPRESNPQGDAMVTDRPGVALGILTADCAPILFADSRAGVIGAAHAGWRGALSGIIEATIAAMGELGAAAAQIVAGIGPCIALQSYEVGPEFPAPFLAADTANSAFFRPARRTGHHLFDLPGYVEARLSRAGIGRIACASRDTLGEEDSFFSYRRSCLRAEKAYGRGLSAIVLA